MSYSEEKTQIQKLKNSENNMCLYPRLINNKKYTSTKKNGGLIPAVTDKRALLVPVGCGKCMECVKKKGREWQIRLNEEVYNDNKALFVTLTFSNESIKALNKEIDSKIQGYERDNYIAKLAVRRFLERWRKKFKKSVKHWLVTELGHNGTENVHLHGLLWTNETEKTVNDIWQYGYIWTNEKNGGVIGSKVVNYITKYCNKIDEKHKLYKPKILTSQGIGKNYINRQNAYNNKYNGKNTKEYYKTSSGHKMALPMYYRNKLYNEEERLNLWMNKLDEGIRYIDGVKVDANNEKLVLDLLQTKREKNNRLGYGNNEKDWQKWRYENELRNIKRIARIINDNETKENLMLNRVNKYRHVMNEEDVIRLEEAIKKHTQNMDIKDVF